MGAYDELQSLQDEINSVKEQQIPLRKTMEKEFLHKCQPIFERRKNVVLGKAKPSEEEKSFKSNDTERMVEEKDGVDDDDNDSIPSEKENTIQEKEDKGIPNFWLHVLKHHNIMSQYITKRDEVALKFLNDICFIYNEKNSSFILEFHFSKNEFFENKILFKEFQFLDFENFFISFSKKHEEIKWKNNENNLSIKIVNKNVKKQKGAKGKNSNSNLNLNLNSNLKWKPCESFFNFFSNEKNLKNEKKLKNNLDEIENLEMVYEKEGIENEKNGENEEIIKIFINDIIPNAIIHYSNQNQNDNYDDNYDENDDDFDTKGSNFDKNEKKIENNFSKHVYHRINALYFLFDKFKDIKIEHKKNIECLKEEEEMLLNAIYERRRKFILDSYDQSSENSAENEMHNFWSIAFRGNPKTVELVRGRDEKLFSHLVDVRVEKVVEEIKPVHRQNEIESANIGVGANPRENNVRAKILFRLIFEFGGGAAAWMASRVLSATFAFVENDAGDWVFEKCEGSGVPWKEDMNVTLSTSKKKIFKLNKKVVQTQTLSMPSFFHLFDDHHPRLFFPKEEGRSLSPSELKEAQASFFETMRDEIIPHAFEFYKSAKEWINEDEEENEDDDDSELDDENENEEETEAGKGGEEDILRKIKERKRKEKEEQREIVCCGLSKTFIFILLALLILSSQVFLYAEYFWMMVSHTGKL